MSIEKAEITRILARYGTVVTCERGKNYDLSNEEKDINDGTWVKKVVQNCLKWRENWTKTSFGLFSPSPPPQINLEGVQKKFVENEKNQCCSKLPEMARKLVEHDFWTF